ncbi:hypothetical protein HOY82DRAFT_538206 [Tuber indicum]|nr:hypothetical protein HOY82DRAFT_538206 [Tuber indicum]
MSFSMLEMSLLASFEGIWETEDLPLLDNESEISTPSNLGSNFAAPSSTNFPEEAHIVGSNTTSPVGKIEEMNQESKAKPVLKKRKTWGQELPIPTTNLPPRKRARTDAEKEQRRVERVLRNRAAAQASRDRKEKEVESLRTERARLFESNNELKAQLLAQEAANSVLSRELEVMKQTLRSYEQYLKVESKEAPGPSILEDENLFQFLLTDAAAPVSALDPGILEWGGLLGQREQIMGLDYL